jgi:hypothetical protein
MRDKGTADGMLAQVRVTFISQMGGMLAHCCAPIAQRDRDAEMHSPASDVLLLQQSNPPGWTPACRRQTDLDHAQILQYVGGGAGVWQQQQQQQQQPRRL